MNSKTTLIALLSIAAASGSVLAQSTPGFSDLYARDQFYDLEARYAQDYETLARRQYDELLAREIVDHLSRREVHEKREFMELLARAAEGDEESGAGLGHWLGKKLGWVHDDDKKQQSSGNSQVVVVNAAPPQSKGAQGSPAAGYNQAPPASQGQGSQTPNTGYAQDPNAAYAQDPSQDPAGAYPAKRGFEDYADLARREMMEELIARAFYEHLDSREDHVERREFTDLLARAADGDEESGAGLVSWFKEHVLGRPPKDKDQSSGNTQAPPQNQGGQGGYVDPNTGYGQDPNQYAPAPAPAPGAYPSQKRGFEDYTHLERREFMDLLARAADGDEESGAGLVSWFKEHVLGRPPKDKDQSSGNTQAPAQYQGGQGGYVDPNGGYGGQDPGVPGAYPAKRDYEELARREYEMHELIARDIVDNLDLHEHEKRELMELLARAAEDAGADGQDEQSGAGLFSIFTKVLGPLLGFGGGSNSRREFSLNELD